MAWLPALLGLWWFRDRFRMIPGAWVMGLVCLAILLLLWRVAVVMGYVSDRHLILPILCGTFWAVAAMGELPRRCLAITSRVPGRAGSLLTRMAASRWTPLALILILAGGALPRSLETLHADRAGFRTVGLWLGEHVTPKISFCTMWRTIRQTLADLKTQSRATRCRVRRVPPLSRIKTIRNRRRPFPKGR